jgi:DNA-binding NarL/FixJ family response regulator
MSASLAPADGRDLRVFIVDDHTIVRAGLGFYLGAEPGMTVIGEAVDGNDALDQIAVLANAGSLPDVVLMDLLMPVMDGITATRAIKRRWPAVQVIAVTSVLDQRRIRAVLESGASGYLLKDADADDLVDAIREAVAGEVHLHPAAARALTASLCAERSPAEGLTPREREVVILIAEGGTNRQIASRLGVTERTARTHVSNILGKLGLESRTQLAMWAVRHGILPEEHRPTG